MLLHGSASSSAQWRKLRPRLESGFRVLAPDLFGHGGTDPWPGRGPLTLADEAMLVAALIGNSAWPVHLVGHAYGAAVALNFAVRHPERLASLTLIEPLAVHLLKVGSGPERVWLNEIEGLWRTVLAGLANGDRFGAIAAFVDYWHGAGAFEMLDEARQEQLAGQLAPLALNFHATLTEVASIHACRRIRVPTLLLQGGRSPRPLRRITELLAEALPFARTATLAAAGHMLPLTHGEQVNALIQDHLLATTRPLAAAA